MLVLDAPIEDDHAVLVQLLARRPWKRAKETWTTAYVSYILFSADPWRINPATFSKPRQKALRKLYDTRKRNGALRRIKRTRRLKCCRYVRLAKYGHFGPLPTKPLFSGIHDPIEDPLTGVLVVQLQRKADTYRGEPSPERFIHPYFDKLADSAIWPVKVLPPYEAPRFKAEPMSNLSADETSIIRFHLDNVLGEQFYGRVETFFDGYPQRVRDAKEFVACLNDTDTKDALRHILHDVVKSGSRNCWEATLIRGILLDANVIAHISDEANIA
ncbi:hypothetical protein [Agrobacterium vitis]|uniref:hypothetical protein n=1 Tax=Agrobacterium vitis TaxID=373 RepID=UPI003D2AD58A